MTPAAALLAALLAAPLGAKTPPPRHFVLIVVDDLRADHLGAYGRSPSLTPRLDALAAESAVFLDANAQAGWTLPSMGSLLTGLYPTEHGVHRALDTGWAADGHADRLALAPGHRLPRERLTIAKALGRGGYETAAFVSCPFGDPAFGWDNGFSLYESAGGSFADVAERTGHWLKGRDPSKPFFLYLHAFDAHAGEEHGALAPEQEKAVRERYARGVAAFDEGFGRLSEALKAAGAWDDALLVVTADHGEELWDCGHQGHGASTCASALRVPLLVRPPGGAARRVGASVGLIDLFPTLTGYAGLRRPAGLPGADLRPLIAGGSLPARAVFTEIYAHYPLGNEALSAVVARDGEWELVSRYGDAQGRRDELYLVSKDPGRRADALLPAPLLQEKLAPWPQADRDRLLRDSPAAYKRLSAETAAWRKKLDARKPKAAASGRPGASPETIEKLRAAGYVR